MGLKPCYSFSYKKAVLFFYSALAKDLSLVMKFRPHLIFIKRFQVICK